MSHSVTHLKDHPWIPCLSAKSTFKPISLIEENSLDGSNPGNFSLQGLFRAVRVGNAAGLLARINYYFPKGIKASGQEACRYAEVLNRLLVHSRVFVVQDIDGDLGYYLRLDAVLQGQYERNNLTTFLDNVRQDIAVLLQYFSDSAPAA